MTLQFVLFALAATMVKGQDPSLSKRIKAGNHEAFKRFFDAHFDGLLRFLISRNMPLDAAKDLVQQAFIYIWEHRDNIDPGKSLRAYIFKIAYTRMLNYHRDNQKFNNDETIPEREIGLTPEDISRSRDLEDAIDRAVDAMPKKRGMVFRLCFIQDFTYKEAAQVLDVSRKTVENHMGLAFKDIRKSLAKFK